MLCFQAAYWLSFFDHRNSRPKKERFFRGDDDVVGAVPKKLNFGPMLFEGKHAFDIVRPSCGPSVRVKLDTSDGVLDVASMSGHLRRHVMKALIHGGSVLKRSLTHLLIRKPCVKH